MIQLREIRKSKKLTMKELGAKVGVSESAISQYETGKREADYATLVKLADIFNCTVDDILGRELEKPSIEQDTRYAELSDENKEFIDQMIDKLLASQSPS